jgi:glycine betaine/proline transport system permease protein
MPSIDPGQYVQIWVLWLSQRCAAVFDVAAHMLTATVRLVEEVLSTPAPLIVIAVLGAAPLVLRRFGLAAFAWAALWLILAMRLWAATVETLSLVLVSTAVAVVLGIPLGIGCSVNRTLSVITRPALDFMQTLPAYVYLIPAVFFFGVGTVPAVVATAIFAIPPAVRMTELGLRQVDPELVEAAVAFGAHPWRVLREVRLPLARPSIMAGVNQVIMLALSMVVISGLVGGGGLGGLVVSAVTQLDIGAGFNSGLAVVLLAIYLDRTTAALGGASRPGAGRAARALRRRAAATTSRTGT